MLLKVEVYPFTGDAFQGTEREPDQTAHVCLATSIKSDNDKGRLLTVGRKTGDIMISNDKSVSREHCIVRMVTTNKTLPKAPAMATTAEQQQACQESSFYQCAVVLEGIGKLGTFIVEEVPTSNKHPTVSNGGNDSDTDEEGDTVMMVSQPGMAASQASQLPMSPWIRNLVLGNQSTDGSKLLRSRLVNQSTILKELNVDNGRVVIMLGKQESVVVLTRIPLYVQRSKGSFSKQSNLPAWWSTLYTAGVVDVTNKVSAGTLLHEKTTHLIAATRAATHRHLCAWLQHIPIVKAEYFQALLQRKSLLDPLPDSAEYATPYTTTTRFYENPPVPNVWSGLTYVSMTSVDEWPEVVEAMGGAVCRLYTEASQHAESDSDADEEEYSQQRVAQFDPMSTFSVDEKNKRSNRHTKPLKEANIHLYTPKEIAKAVSNCQVLEGLAPSAAVAAPPAASSRASTSATSPLATQSTMARNATMSGVAALAKPLDKSEKGDKDEEKVASSKDPPAAPMENVEEPKESTAAATIQAEKAVTPKKRDVSDDDNKPEPKTRSKARDTSNKASTPIKTRRAKLSVKDSPDGDDDSEPETRRRGSRRTTQRSTEEAPQKDQVETADKSLGGKKETEKMDVDESLPLKKNEGAESSTSPQEADRAGSKSKKREAKDAQESEEEDRPAKRVKLTTSTDGWLKAAPSNRKKRKELARTKEEIVEAYRGDSNELYTKAAATEWAPKPKVNNADVSQTQSRHRRATGPNFKAFRKNPVPPAAAVMYQFKAVKSMPSAQLAQFAEETAAADEHLRKVNELFQDGGRKTTSTGRRGRAQ